MRISSCDLLAKAQIKMDALLGPLIKGVNDDLEIS